MKTELPFRTWLIDGASGELSLGAFLCGTGCSDSLAICSRGPPSDHEWWKYTCAWGTKDAVLVTAGTNRDAAWEEVLSQHWLMKSPNIWCWGSSYFLLALQGCLWQLGTISFNCRRMRETREWTDFVNTMKLRKIWAWGYIIPQHESSLFRVPWFWGLFQALCCLISVPPSPYALLIHLLSDLRNSSEWH